jgi:glycosyltransferase involved in cell wall biosynthesis
MENRKVSICVPTWNRFDFTTKCFEQVLNDERVGEVVITDDCSDDGSFEALKEFYSKSDKVNIYRNENRLKVHGNKHESIWQSTHDWCILFDSDNLITKEYLDVIFSYDWENNVAYQPSFAMPHFDYRNLVGTYDKGNIKEHLHLPLFECMLNTQNFFINRNNYLSTWEYKDQINGADSIYFNYLWLNKGNKIKVVENLHYEHLVHRGSFYESVAEDSLPKSLEIVEQIKNF